MNEVEELKINHTNLQNYRSSQWTKDYFSDTSDGLYKIVFYNIDEYRMMCYASLLAIYKTQNLNHSILNSGKQFIDFDWQNTYTYLEKSKCLVFRKPASTAKPKKGEHPFLLIKPEENKFAFVEWDLTSVYFGLEEINIDIARIVQVHPKDIARLKLDARENELIKLNDLIWFDLENFEDAINIYHN